MISQRMTISVKSFLIIIACIEDERVTCGVGEANVVAMAVG